MRLKLSIKVLKRIRLACVLVVLISAVLPWFIVSPSDRPLALFWMVAQIFVAIVMVAVAIKTTPTARARARRKI